MDGPPGVPRTSREVALEVLHRVDAHQAWSTVLLRRVLDRAALRPADAALATELTLGTLRHRAEVDWVLSRVSTTPLDELPSSIRTVLRIGAYQLLFLDRIPPRAACSEAVALAKRVGHPGTARLVNAVLRRIAADPIAIPADESTTEGIALRHSHPVWLVAPLPGETVVDACAGSGGKALHLAALMGNQGRVHAWDVVPAKLDALTRHARRVGAGIIEPRLLDATRLSGVLPEADRVLVDA